LAVVKSAVGGSEQKSAQQNPQPTPFNPGGFKFEALALGNWPTDDMEF